MTRSSPARRARRQEPQAPAVPKHLLPVAPPDARPGAKGRLALLRDHEADIRHAYHQGVMKTDPEDGHVVTLVARTEPLWSSLAKGASRLGSPHDVAILTGPRRLLSLLFVTSEPVNPLAADELEIAPRGVLVVAVVAFGGITVWWLRDSPPPASGWAPAAILFERSAS